MSVTLRKRMQADGSTSLLLDIYHNGKRRYEFLKHLKLVKPANPADRANNKNQEAQAKAIAIQRAAELQANDYNMVSDAGKKTIVVRWMQSYVDDYNKGDKRNMQGVTRRFDKWLMDTGNNNLTFNQLTESMVTDFKEYLNETSEGEGSASYFARFKKMMKSAYRAGLMLKNPSADVPNKNDGAKKKAVLTLDEIRLLAQTPIQSDEIRRAALFSCVTGLRWIDVKNLKWQAIDIPNKRMDFEQTKTEKDNSVPLNDTAIMLLGAPGNKTANVFDLPTANGANKTVKAWVKRAGIDKAITWHNFRHSFGTNLIYNKVDIVTASQLLGHASLRHTQRYVDSANDLKRDATNKLNLGL
jgi:site-specific recombinase XerD